jgi:peptidoglycan/xylan/chitin deacetylase (PgdA/CDA1 family)
MFRRTLKYANIVALGMMLVLAAIFVPQVHKDPALPGDTYKFAACPSGLKLAANRTNPNPNPELLVNGGAELGEQGWTNGHWGNNVADFRIANAGHTGTHSFRAEMRGHTLGDGKWLPQAPVPVQGGTYYQFSVWYRTDTDISAAVEITMADGKTLWHNLDIGPRQSSQKWQKFSSGYLMPKDATAAMFAMTISGGGYLMTDDYSVKQAANNAGFRRPLVSLTFDDATPSIYKAIPELDKRGLKSTQFVVAGALNTAGSWDEKQVLSVQSRGHEIASHSMTHPDFTTVDKNSMETEFARTRQELERITKRPVYDFAYPYGSYSSTTTDEARKFYCSTRGVESGYNSKDDLALYGVRVQNMEATTTLTEFKRWVDYARDNHLWLVLVYHAVDDKGDGPFATGKADFTQQLDYLKRTDVPVLTYRQALEEAMRQIN